MPFPENKTVSMLEKEVGFDKDRKFIVVKEIPEIYAKEGDILVYVKNCQNDFTTLPLFWNLTAERQIIPINRYFKGKYLCWAYLSQLEYYDEVEEVKNNTENQEITKYNKLMLIIKKIICHFHQTKQ